MKVVLHPEAQKYLNRLNEPDKGQVLRVLKKLSSDPPEGNIEPLTDRKGYWRVRAGSYRILYKIKTINENNVEVNKIFITNIDPRGQVYNKKNKGR